MLRISGTEPAGRPAVVRTDDHIPLDVSWGYDAALPMLYWRSGDPVWSLVEVGVQRESAAIVSITVPLAGALVRVAAEPEPDVPEEHGHPVCDVRRWWDDDRSAWKEWHCVDEPGLFHLSVHGDRVRVSFASDEPVARAVVSGSTRFELSARGDLLAVSIGGVGTEDRERMVETVARERAMVGTRIFP